MKTLRNSYKDKDFTHKITEENIKKGVLEKQPFRNQIISKEIIEKIIPGKRQPEAVILDVGHNPPATVLFLFSIELKNFLA